MPEPRAAAPVQRASLRGCRVLVTRPAHQAEALCALIESAGGEPLRLPMIDIVPVADPAAAADRLEALRGADRWIFSSTNAVREAARLARPPWPATAAVGQATAAALSALGCPDVLAPPHGDGALALLAHPRLQPVRGQLFALVSGEQPLPELARVLLERGASVESVPVYRRVPVIHAPAAVAAAVQAADIAIVPSAEALQQLVASTPPEARPALFALPLAVPSPRVVENARALGFRTRPLLPQQVSDAGYLDLLLHHLNPGEQDRPTDRS